VSAFRAGIVLAWYLGVGLGLPMVDGFLFHHGSIHDTVHVERADNPDCHRERCSILSTAPPQALATRDALPTVAVHWRRAAAPARPALLARDERAAHPLGSRAPPRVG
jgi:hypothetical protein